MARHARLASVAVEAAMDASHSAQATARMIDAALQDGVVTEAEARAMLLYARQTVKRAEDVVLATEQTNVAQKAVISMLTVHPFTPQLRREAADVGLVLEFPAAEPLDAA